jgi:anionic cell wall polymer biosynthesis LytR-Cps2A-Psr (LCP) family protein
LDGELATEFLRTKLPGGDGARQQRQNLFLDAFQDQMLSTKTISKAPELFEQFKEAITTDFSPKLVADLACLMERITPENTNYHALPGEFVSFDEEEELMTIVDKPGLLAYIEEIFD